MTETIIGIDGMMCDMCEAHINDIIRRHFSVKSVKANRKRKTCVVLSEEPLDQGRIAKVIGEAGYELLSFSSKVKQKKGLFGLF